MYIHTRLVVSLIEQNLFVCGLHAFMCVNFAEEVSEMSGSSCATKTARWCFQKPGWRSLLMFPRAMMMVGKGRSNMLPFVHHVVMVVCVCVCVCLV